MDLIEDKTSSSNDSEDFNMGPAQKMNHKDPELRKLYNSKINSIIDSLKGKPLNNFDGKVLAQLFQKNPLDRATFQMKKTISLGKSGLSTFSEDNEMLKFQNLRLKERENMKKGLMKELAKDDDSESLLFESDLESI